MTDRPGPSSSHNATDANLRGYPIESIDAVIAYAKARDDGCMAHSTEFRDGKPKVAVLVATTPERAALLHALHNAWYPEEDDD